MSGNDAQAEYWNGKAAQMWVAEQASMDATLRPLGEAAMDALSLQAGQRVLDVGCGCGDSALALADLVGPSGAVTGVDISAPMLEVARARARGRANLTFVHGDAAAMELPRVDRLFSRFGVMFFADPAAAFTHLRGALSPDGRMAFVCWRDLDDNGWAKVPMDAVASVVGPPNFVDPDAPGPFAFAEAHKVASVLWAAGFSNVSVEPEDYELRWTDTTDEQAIRDKFVGVGPAARMLLEATPDQKARASDAVWEAVRTYIRPDGLWMPAAVWIVTAGR